MDQEKNISQYKVGGYDKNLSYVIWDRSQGACGVVDPTGDLTTLFRDITDAHCSVTQICITHTHHDHIDGIDRVRKAYPEARIVAHRNAQELHKKHDNLHFVDGGDVVQVGSVDVQVVYTPGHSVDAVCYYIKEGDIGFLITGDTLFVEGCGRVTPDDAPVLYASLEKIIKFEGDTVVLPGHDYGPQAQSTISRELTRNRFLLARTYEDFLRERFPSSPDVTSVKNDKIDMKMKLKKFFRNYRLLIVLVLLICMAASILAYWLIQRRAQLTLSDALGPYDIEADALANNPYIVPENASPITGLACASFDQRPLAVMYSGNAEVRPYLSGISEAGFVVEMAHRFPSGATRKMGVFDCVKPFRVGPLAGGRVDFLGVAASFDAIYVPWGGGSISQNLLQQGVQNHIDCSGAVLPGGEADACYIEDETKIQLSGEDLRYGNAINLAFQVENLEYNLTNTFSGFEHRGDTVLTERPDDGILEVNHLEGFQVTYIYDPEFNRYERFVDGAPEVDFNTGERIAPRNVIVFKTDREGFAIDGNYEERGLQDPWDGIDAESRLNDDGIYPNFSLGDAWFDTARSGWAHFYLDGQEIIGTWERDPADPRTPFRFLDGEGQLVQFLPGQIWMHVLEGSRSFQWLQ